MESVASNSTPHEHRNRRPNPRFRVPHPVAGRIVRAIQNSLLLLHRSGPNFFVLGATGNVYSVTLSATPSCTCPDRSAPCKHILFVLIRVLGIPLNDPCLHRKTLRPCQLDRLLATPSLPGTLAGAGLQEMFHRHFYLSRQGLTQRSAPVQVEEGSICPVCLDEIRADGQETIRKGVVACETCRNPIHEECLLKWKRSRGRRPAICVICRARWRNRMGQEKYVNLAAYVVEDDRAHEDNNNGGGRSCGD
ncbi:mitogen-activated protein kinase kinase kinase 1 [Punica granatum]|uniref:Uncharacterized protein n=2 Tax=Punica granatum TaxID=22663 RepID=A0A218XDR5_PUNGR|nr:mitogen-activated protein kinase kinase kinase 1 [Punica granatum]OWM82839.1 hypothetical protein CDL15_Pgr029200 [Punica granatum]PKI46451.1 hypothetical protein CRG98_033149 [Punica granatum]